MSRHALSRPDLRIFGPYLHFTPEDTMMMGLGEVTNLKIHRGRELNGLLAVAGGD